MPDPSPRQRSLPPHLEFLREFNGPFPEDSDELVIHLRRLLAQAREHRAEIRALGVDLDRHAAGIEATLAKLAETGKQVDTATENHLQAAADLAAASCHAYKAAKALVEAACEENPFDPNVQEAREFVDEWRQQMPKE